MHAFIPGPVQRAAKSWQLGCGIPLLLAMEASSQSLCSFAFWLSSVMSAIKLRLCYRTDGRGKVGGSGILMEGSNQPLRGTVKNRPNDKCKS